MQALGCWKCAHSTEENAAKVGFRALCPSCSAALHSCLGCRHYAPGRPNDCAIPGTDPIRDREGVNFCEEFAARLTPSSSIDRTDALKRARRLLGEDIGD